MRIKEKSVKILPSKYTIEDYNDIIRKYVIPNNSSTNTFFAWCSKTNDWVELVSAPKRKHQRITNTEDDIRMLKEQLVKRKTVEPTKCNLCGKTITDGNDLKVSKEGDFFCSVCY